MTSALTGKRVLVTRAREQASSTADLLRARGAEAVAVPTIEIHPPTDVAPMRRAIANLWRAYDWVVFTSANGVEQTWAEMVGQGIDASVLSSKHVAAIGPGTAKALARQGVRASIVAKESRGEGLADELLRAFGDAQPRVLLARAEVARDVLPDALRAAGCYVDVVAVYATRVPRSRAVAGLARALDDGSIDAVLLTSGSTVDNLCDCLGEHAVALLARACVASIGPVTSDAAARRGVRVDVVAREPTVASLVDALERSFEALNV